MIDISKTVKAWNHCADDSTSSCKDCTYVETSGCTSKIAEDATELIRQGKVMIVSGKPKYHVLVALKEVRND